MNKKDNINLITKKNIRYDIDKIIDKLNTKYENIKEVYNIIVPKVKQSTYLKSLFHENNKKNLSTDRNICKLTMNITNNNDNITNNDTNNKRDDNKKIYNENINSIENQTIRSISNTLLNKHFFLYNSPKKKDLKGRDIYSDFENFIYSSVAKSTKKCVSPKKIQYLFSDNSIHETVTVRNMKRQNNLTKKVYIERDDLDIIYDNFIEQLKESGLSNIIKQEQFKSNNKNLLIKNRKLTSLRNYIFNDCNSYTIRKKNENDSFNNITFNSLNRDSIRNDLDRNFLKELDKKTEKKEDSINKIDDPSITYFNKYFTINNTGGVIRKKMAINIKKSYNYLLKMSKSKSKSKSKKKNSPSHSNDKQSKTEKKRKANIKINNSTDISYLIENIKKKNRKNLSLSSLYSYNNNNNNNNKLKSVKFSNDQQFTMKNTSITSIKSIIKNKTESKLKKNIVPSLPSPPKKKLNLNILDNKSKIRSIKNSITSSHSTSLFKNKNKKLTLNNLQSISSNFNNIKDRIDLINNTLNLQTEIDDDLNKFKKFELIKVNDPGVVLFKRDKQKLYMPNLMNKTTSSSTNNILDNKLFTNMIIKSELATKLNSNSTIKFSTFLKKTFSYNEEKRKEEEFKKTVDLSNGLINRIDNNSHYISKIMKKIKKVEED